MAPAIETSIWLALKSRLDTLPGGFTVYEPDAAVTPGQAPFILVSDAQNDPERTAINASLAHRRTGTLVLSLHYPIAQPLDHTQLREMQGAIAAHFPADMRMSYKRICLRATVDASTLAPYRDGAYRVAVIRVPWSTV